jgi:PAS domain S-box-containing protein
MPSRLNATLLPYGVAVLAIAASLPVRWALRPLMGDGYPFLTFFPAVMLAAFFGGLRPGLLATGLGAACTVVWLIEPLFPLGEHTAWDLFRLSMFVLTGLIISGLNESLHGARRRLEAAAEQYRASEARYRATLTSIGDAVIATDSKGQVSYLNPVAGRLTGWNQGEAVGRPLAAVFRILNEETRRPVENPVERVVRTGLVVGLANHTLLVARDGTERPIDDSAAPIRDETGSIDGVVLVFRDVTERRRAEAALRRSEVFYRTLGEAVPDFVWSGDSKGILDYVNQRWRDYTGLTLEELNARGWQVVHHPDEREALDCQFQAAGRAGLPFEAEVRYRRRDGVYRWFLARSVPTRTEEGRVRWYGTLTDIDDRKRAEEALQEANRRKDEFLAMLGHELRNPLAPVRNALHILRHSHAGDPTVEQLRALMERQVGHMVRLVEDLLDVSRISRGQIELRKAPVELSELITRTLEGVRPLFAEKRHRLEVELSREPLRLEADSTRLEQMLANLLTNAAKYTPPEGRVRLTLGREGGEAVLRVRDDGIGIRPEMLPRIFDMFQQADRIPGRVAEGLGLGLTLVHRLVELHGGGVTAHSAGPGQGSEFVVRLPLAPAAPATESASSSGAPVRAGPSRRVLVVDDNIDAAESMALLLRLSGHEVRVVYDGPSALAEARAHRPEVVLLDIGLPRGMDGYEVARRLRRECGLADVLLVAVTGYGQEEDRRRALEAGFDEHLTKPVDLDRLRQLVAREEARSHNSRAS